MSLRSCCFGMVCTAASLANLVVAVIKVSQLLLVIADVVV